VRLGQEREFPDRNRTLTLRYQFVHVLYQNTLYASMTPARKAALSRAVATALEGFYGDRTADVASELAVLFEVAREWSLATNYYRVAAKKAADVFANEEALVLGRRALDQLRALPDEPARHRQELDILLTMGVPATAARGYSSREVQEIYDRASALCMELQEIDPLARVLRGLFAYNIVRLQLNAAQEACNRMNDLARRSEEPAIALGTNVGAVHYYRGEFEPAAAYLEHAAVTDDLGVRRSMCVTFGYDPIVGIHNYLGWSLWCLGYPDRARTEIQKSLEFAGQMNPYTMAFALTFMSGLSYWCGDWEQLRIHNERTLALAKKEGFAYFAATSICLEGLWLAANSHLDEGLVRIRKGWDALSAIEGRATQLRFASDFAECLARAGRWEEAFDLLTGEIDATRTARFQDAELIRVKGELLLMRGAASDTTQAEACFEQALDVARQQRAKSFELRAAMSLVRMWQARGKSAQAASLLRVTFGWFTEGHETADLRRARELLAATAGGVP
jgi:tetratricopeptide (TPR) repeat protein